MKNAVENLKRQLKKFLSNKNSKLHEAVIYIFEGTISS